MKKLLLNVSLFAALLGGYSATAQETTTIQVFDKAVFYGMYEGTVNTPKPEGAVRNSNSSYGKKLTDEQIVAIGNTLKMTVILNPLCDNYDRIGKVNLAFVPKGATSYDYKTVSRIEIGRYITPFMNKNAALQEVPYEFQIDNVAKIVHDENLAAQYDFWVELEVYGYQGDDRGGAVKEIAGCAGRNDVWQGSLKFETSTNTRLTQGPNFFAPILTNYELKNYTLDGTDEIGKTVKTVTVTLDKDFPNAKIYLITSNHGSGTNGEEYVRRQHNVYFDDALKLSYTPGGKSCVPYRKYNTQGSCIYYDCSTNPATLRPNTDAAWAWNNWCPGNAIPTRVVELGDLKAGTHKFKIEVPRAEFFNKDGYFPTSAYMVGGTEVLGTDKFAVKGFSISPNPTTSVATINADGLAVKNVSVVNTLGQVVLTGASQNVDLSSLQSGVYMVKVLFDNNQTATQKVIKK